MRHLKVKLFRVLCPKLWLPGVAVITHKMHTEHRPPKFQASVLQRGKLLLQLVDVCMLQQINSSHLNEGDQRDKKKTQSMIRSCLYLHLKYSKTAQSAVKRNDYRRMSWQWFFDYDFVSSYTHKVSGVSVKSGSELEAAVSSRPNPISPTASQLIGTLPEKTLALHQPNDISTVHYKYTNE